MSVKHIGLVLDNFETNVAALKLVAVILADHADSDGYCFPSYRRISDRANIHERSVQRHVGKLQELGIITKVRTGTVIKREGRTLRVSNAYKFNDEMLETKGRKVINNPLLITTRDVYLEVDMGVVNRSTPVSTKSSFNRKRVNRNSLTPVSNSKPDSLGDVLDGILGTP